MNIENKNSLVTKVYDAISDLTMHLERLRDDSEEVLTTLDTEIYNLSNELWEKLRLHPDFWEPNPEDNPDLFDADGDILPMTKAELAAIVPITKEERDFYYQELDTLLTEGFGQLIKLADDRGLNKSQFAAVLNIPPSLLSNYQAGRKRITIAMLAAYASKINLQVSFELLNKKVFFKPINKNPSIFKHTTAIYTTNHTHKKRTNDSHSL